MLWRRSFFVSLYNPGYPCHALSMVCDKCRDGKHRQCPAVKKKQSTWCDCQHKGADVAQDEPKSVSE